MPTDSVLTALAVSWTTEVDQEKKATNECSVRYGLTVWKVLQLEKDTVQVGKPARGRRGTLSSETLGAVPVFYRGCLVRADISANCGNEDEYCRLSANPKAASAVNLSTFLNQDLLYAQAWKIAEISEAALIST